MKAIPFILATTGLLYASNRWEWVGLALIGFYLAGAIFLVFYSLYRHLAANRFF